MGIIDNFNGVVFDLDGVLIDTECLHCLSWIEILKPLGIDFSQKEYFNYSGKREDIIAVELIEKYKLNIDKDSLFRKKKELMEKFVREKEIRLMSYSKETIEFVINLKKPIAVCTGSQREEALIKLNKSGLSDFFNIVITGSDVKRGKPYPDIYLLAAEKLGLKPSKCIAFEDTQYGVESAKSAGLYCIAIPGEYSKNQDFSKTDKVFKNLKQAIDYLSD